ncbi:polynucleotide kinase-phosphatase [Ureibacillus sinduriensis]|uniref:Diadenosine tetraphosphatase n=1 Tax=Ureibacillus sinduriensis BLB-1 = JCM 15800 TaxID=1384057 RepID=A0A0A3HRS1_9BACL|nr:polynucleotide kinase-phosphatase [Ureibacillus sinduriensis]KGR75104.1 diadenosine tetraphosphatase [Ureibacillus sinduriensis BLB-1 = JCM 15800]
MLPYAGIILLIGPSNSGKSTLLKQLVDTGQVLSSEIISSDEYRVRVSDVEFIDWSHRWKDVSESLYDEYQRISAEAFSLMEATIEARCRLNKITFVDATHLYPDDRKRYIELAKKHHVAVMSLVLDVDEEVLLSRDKNRINPRGKKRIKQQYQVFKREKRFIKKEGYSATYFITDTDEVEVTRANSNPVHLEVDNGIDIIGDIHGCYDEMIQLLEQLGYEKNAQELYVHPDGRKFLSLGDIMSRGPESLKTMLFFLRHVKENQAYMVDSNHASKIARWLEGNNVTLNHGDELVAQEFEQYEHTNELAQLKEQLKEFLLNAPSHYVLTKNGIPTLVCTHAGIKDEFIGKQSDVISDYCRYGDHEGLDDTGRPIRKDWTIHHKTSLLVVWGHDPKPKSLIINNTINIDQGVVFGGELTAFRYPEKKFVAVQAKEDYSKGQYNPLIELKKKRLDPPNIAKFNDGFSVLTGELGKVKISKQYALASIDSVSHHTIPIEEVVYIPPTMSPTPTTSSLEGYLEHPKEAIDYYRNMGIERMVAQKKHMGSRGILFLFKDTKAGRKYVGRETLGVIYTRTGRRFFDIETEEKVLERINQSLAGSDYFNKYRTEFILLDAEIMPWNLKAKELISSQYAHVAENAILDRSKLKGKIGNAVENNVDLARWLKEYDEKLTNAFVFKEVFQKYCWEIYEIDQIQIAPFHLLAHSHETYFHKPHTWHMEMNKEFALMDNLFVETEYMVIDDEASEEKVIKWWNDMTGDGHEGIVIKPETFISKSNGRLIQPAIKVRGRKYLHIIYGMDYLEPENLKRLKKRNVGKKQKHALKEFALGVEGIERLVNGESIERVHECVLGTLAMESDPVDPRL